jgi:hypothetical protein
MTDRENDDSPRRNPWFKFFPSDWRGDELLTMCSLGARGLLIELLGLMHVADRRGYLLLHGERPTDTELNRLVRGDSTSETKNYLQELLDRGVLSVDPDGTIFSRRMVRDTERSAVGHESGKQGGNPALRAKPLEAPLRVDDKGTLKGPRNPQMPDARGQTYRRGRAAASVRRPARDREAQLARFDLFWKEYPRKVDRKGAEREWLRIQPPPDETITAEIVAAVRHQHASLWKDTEARFIPYASTWLHNARWQDEPEEAPASRAPGPRSAEETDAYLQILRSHEAVPR